MGCDYALDEVPPDPSQLYVFVDKTTLATRDPARKNGWEYSPGSNQVTFYGQACSALQENGAVSVDIVYGCPSLDVE